MKIVGVSGRREKKMKKRKIKEGVNVKTARVRLGKERRMRYKLRVKREGSSVVCRGVSKGKKGTRREKTSKRQDQVTKRHKCTQKSRSFLLAPGSNQIFPNTATSTPSHLATRPRFASKQMPTLNSLSKIASIRKVSPFPRGIVRLGCSLFGLSGR